MNTAPPIDSPLLAQLKHAATQLTAADAPLSVQRHQAFSQFLNLGLPTARDEAWKYTPLRRLATLQFALPNEPTTAAPAQHLLPLTQCYRLVFIDGHWQPLQSTLPATLGLTIVPLSQLLAQQPEQLSTTFTTDDERTAFTLLNQALTTEGVWLKLAAQTTLDKPLLLEFLWTSNTPSMLHPRIVLQLETGAALTLIEHHSSSTDTTHFTNSVSQFKLDAAAQLTHYHLVTAGKNNIHIGAVQMMLQRDAQLTHNYFALGGSLSRLDLQASLQGSNAALTLQGVQYASHSQHHDVHTRIDHCVPHTQSREDYRGIADGRGRVVFNGKVVVQPHAIRTDARQSSRNLLLSPTAEIDTKPELEIYADDVQCTHGATVGQLDAAALFYLRSRGLSEPQARALLIHAFAESIIARVPLDDLRTYLSTRIQARFDSVLDGAS